MQFKKCITGLRKQTDKGLKSLGYQCELDILDNDWWPQLQRSAREGNKCKKHVNPKGKKIWSKPYFNSSINQLINLLFILR